MKYNIDISSVLNSAKGPNIAITNKKWFQESELFTQILKETEWVNTLNPTLSINQRITLIRDNITNFNTCPICKGPVKFFDPIFRTGVYCSKSCSAMSSIDKRYESHQNNNEVKKKESIIHSLKETQDYIRSEFNKTNSTYEQQAIKNGFWKSIMHHNDMEISFITKMYCILHNIIEPPKCKNYTNCNNKINTFVDKNVGFREYCSISCRARCITEPRIETYFNRTGFTHPHYNPEVIKQRKINSNIKWGCEAPQQNQEVKDKIKGTKFERYGDEYYTNQPQKEVTNFKIYGFKTPLQHPEVREKAQNTCLRLYGFKTPFQHPEVREKAQNTCLRLYGFKHYNQSGLNELSGYKWKEYITPKGNIIRYQGYENILFDEIFKIHDEEDIITLRKDMPVFLYIGLDRKEHRYFPDMYIPKLNKIYEVKSEYTLNIKYITNLLKFESVEKLGYDFELRVY